MSQASNSSSASVIVAPSLTPCCISNAEGTKAIIVCQSAIILSIKKMIYRFISTERKLNLLNRDLLYA